MNKINTIYATEIGEIEEPALKKNFNRFSKKLDEHIRETVLLKKTEQLKQSEHLMEQLARIKDRSGKYKKKIYNQQHEFYDKIESIIQLDIDRYKSDQHFFAHHFQALEAQIKDLSRKNQQYKQEIQLKANQLKLLRQRTSPSLLSSLQQPIKSQQLSTIESSLKISRNNHGKRIKTDQSLPALRSDRYQRLKTVQSEYDSHAEKARNRSGSYMEPIGSVRAKESSCLPLLLELLQWYEDREDINSSWFLKVIFTERNYSKLRSYIEAHSGSRTVTYKK